MKSCEFCGGDFEPARYQSGTQRFCGEPCRKEHANKTARTAWKLCPAVDCGQPFKPIRRSHRYCSATCCRRAYSMRKRLWADAIPCEHCEAEFTPTRKTQRFCSPTCRIRARHYRLFEYAEHAKVQCVECEGWYMQVNTGQKYCSKTCNNRAARRRFLAKPGNAEKMEAARQRWRAANPGYAARMQRIYYRRKKHAAD